MKIIWHGTASVEMRSGESRFLSDPFLPLSGAEWRTDIAAYDGFPDILITHGHFDHIVQIPEIIRRNPDTVVHCTGTPYNTLRGKGVPERNLKLVRYGDHFSLGAFSVDVCHGRHAVLPRATPKRVLSILFSRNVGNLPYIARENRICAENGETVLYVVRAEGLEVTVMGSLNLRDDTIYPEGSDLLLLPYNGWEDNFPPAVQVIERLKPKRVLLTHWDDTFPPLTGPIDRSPIYREYPGLICECRPGETLTL